MVDLGGGFFLGIKFCMVLVVVTIEAYFLVLGRRAEGDIEGIEFVFLSFISALCIIIPIIQLTRFSVGLWLIIPVPAFYAIFRFLEGVQVERADKNLRNSEIRNLEKVIAEKPEIPETYVLLGDIFFKQSDYSRAIPYYKKAYGIKETAEVHQKIRIAEKERRIQKGEIWVCGQCGTDNSGEWDKCRNCGYSKRLVKSVGKDLAANRDEIKRWIFNGTFIAVLAVVLIKIFLAPIPFYIALLFFLMAIYVVLRKFFT